ncbi:transposase, IS5 family [Neisseria meningitidis]|nr:transposase, IS5 family [Neisseria meningitidis]
MVFNRLPAHSGIYGCNGCGVFYSGLNFNQDKATKPQTVQIVRQGEATLYWFKFNPL